MQYSTALILYKNDGKLRAKEEYIPILRSVFDLDKFWQHLINKEEVSDPSVLYLPNRETIKKKGADLVVDTRETWKQFFKRVYNFEPAPLVERAELPPEKQPNKTVYGKLACYMNGVSPYPPRNPPAEVKIEDIKQAQPEVDQKYEVIGVGKDEVKKEQIPPKPEEESLKKKAVEENKE